MIDRKGEIKMKNTKTLKWLLTLACLLAALCASGIIQSVCSAAWNGGKE